MCGFGTYSPSGLVPCLECPRNSFTMAPPPDGFKECSSCPPETFTHAQAANDQSLCRGERTAPAPPVYNRFHRKLVFGNREKLTRRLNANKEEFSLFSLEFVTEKKM